MKPNWLIVGFVAAVAVAVVGWGLYIGARMELRNVETDRQASLRAKEQAVNLLGAVFVSAADGSITYKVAQTRADGNTESVEYVETTVPVSSSVQVLDARTVTDGRITSLDQISSGSRISIAFTTDTQLDPSTVTVVYVTE
jgi:hypothetical protein